jgi:hypothetical protein
MKKPRTRWGQLYARTPREAAPTEKLSRASSLVYGRSLCVDFSRLKVFIERRAGDWLAEGRTVRSASASVLTPDTMSIVALQMRAIRQIVADADRRAERHSQGA